MKSEDICTICDGGHLELCIDKNVAEYKGRSTELDMQYSVCNACGSEQASATQLRVNKRAMMVFKKQVDELLTGEDVRAVREHLGINQSEAARIFGGGPVAFSKYESDDVAQSEAMDKLLRLAVALPAAFSYLAEKAGVVAGWNTIGRCTDLQYHSAKAEVISITWPEPKQEWRDVG